MAELPKMAPLPELDIPLWLDFLKRIYPEHTEEQLFSILKTYDPNRLSTFINIVLDIWLAVWEKVSK